MFHFFKEWINLIMLPVDTRMTKVDKSKYNNGIRVILIVFCNVIIKYFFDTTVK